MNLLMRSALRRHTRPVICGLILALAAMVSAECVMAEDLTPAQMACCATMNHDCGAMAQKQDCCSTAAPRVDQGSASPRMSLAAPHAGVVRLVMHLPALPSPLSPQKRPFKGFEAKPPGVPTYLLISTFRI